MDYLEDDPNPAHNTRFPDIENLLEESQEARKKRLENELDRINKELENRERIHEEAINELESKLDWYVERLKTLYKQRRGENGKRDRLRNRIEEFYREIREENRAEWRDRKELEMERREVLRELEEVEDTALSELLGDV